MATKKVYWDACAWIAYINKETSVNGINRFALCESVILNAVAGQIEIATSAFTLAEVCKSSKIKAGGVHNLSSFFDQPYILLAPVDRVIGTRAQDIQQAGTSNLKPPDAIHIASALELGINEMHTFDKGILKLDGAFKINSKNSLIIKNP